MTREEYRNRNIVRIERANGDIVSIMETYAIVSAAWEASPTGSEKEKQFKDAMEFIKGYVKEHFTFV